MNILKSIALTAAFIGNAFLAHAQEKGDGTYYSEEQRQRIHTTLVNAKPTDNPVAKKLPHEPKSSVDTLNLGDIRKTDAIGYKIVGLKKLCSEANATQIAYTRGDGFYNVALADLEELEENYGDLHRALDLPHKTDMGVAVEPGFNVSQEALDTVYSTFVTSFETLENFSRNAMFVFQGNIAGKSYVDYRSRKKPIERTYGALYVPESFSDPFRKEYDADSIDVAFYEEYVLEALEEFAGFLNQNVADGNASRKEKRNIIEKTYGFDQNYDRKSPSLGLRWQRIDAQLRYQSVLSKLPEKKDRDIVQPPADPPRVKNWELKPTVN